ncbi:carbohydrate sulfotransferase 6 isoform X2 [Mugil cephalus]|nr:carbohydrate sulfotransferase 6 isoform X2 [Mugil cephalus]XP_047452684.1 carbohydrate sulfotransferase 6 isoform X2 [Mugil cephalus]
MRFYNKVSINTMILLVFMQGATVLLFCSWYYQISPCSISVPNKKTHVLLLSSWRSGSSFLGQVFSQNPSVFYLMEPGWHVWTTLRSGGRRELKMAVRDQLRSVFKCDFSVMDSYMPPTQRNVSSLFMWSHSRALCSPPACSLTPRDQLSDQEKCSQKCGRVGLEKAEEACSTYSHVVLKEVRLFELESLYPLFKDPDLDLRIVHLVRDPRAVMRSKDDSAKSFELDNSIVVGHQKLTPAEAQSKALQEICRSHVSINERAIVKPPPFLQGRYKLIRYEDMARSPLEEVSSLYEFLGLEMTLELEEWIYKVTHGKGHGSRSDAFKITSRNAADISQAWRTMLPYSKVKHIQDICKGAMSLLGYRTVNSEAEQKKLDLDLLVPQEPYEFTWDKPQTQQPKKT